MMPSKGAIQHTSIDAVQFKDVDTKKSATSRKSVESKLGKSGRRSQSLDRLEENSGDSRDERRNRRQFMHLISEKNEQIEKLIKRVTTLQTLNNEFAVEHERIEHELLGVQQRCTDYERERQNGCNLCRTLAKQNDDKQLEIDRLTTEHEQLVSDIGMMKVLIYRLNVQLENYQELLRKQNIDSKSNYVGRTRNGLNDTMAATSATPIIDLENIESIDWGSIHSHVLAPLLNAYQETIKEKTNLVKQYDRELNQVTGRIKDILSENDELHRQIDEANAMNETWHSQKVRMQAQLDVCRSKAEVHSKRADLAKEKLMEVIRCYEQKLQAQSIDIQRLQDAHSRLKSEQTNCHTMHQQPELVVESLKERQRLFDEAKVQHETEKAKLIEEINALKEVNQRVENECQTLKLKLTEQKSAIDAQNEKLGTYTKKMEKLRSKFLRMQQSREMIKSRLRSAITWNRKVEAAAKTISWQDLRKIEQLLVQKESQLQQLRQQYQTDIDKLQRKLHRRDEMLRKILLNKVKRKTN